MKNIIKNYKKIALTAAFAGLLGSTTSSYSIFSCFWRSIAPKFAQTYFTGTKAFKSQTAKQTFEHIKNGSKHAFKKAKQYKKPLLTASAIGGGAYGAHKALQFLNKPATVHAEENKLLQAEQWTAKYILKNIDLIFSSDKHIQTLFFDIFLRKKTCLKEEDKKNISIPIIKKIMSNQITDEVYYKYFIESYVEFFYEKEETSKYINKFLFKEIDIYINKNKNFNKLYSNKSKIILANISKRYDLSEDKKFTKLILKNHQKIFSHPDLINSFYNFFCNYFQHSEYKDYCNNKKENPNNEILDFIITKISEGYDYTKFLKRLLNKKSRQGNIRSINNEFVIEKVLTLLEQEKLKNINFPFTELIERSNKKLCKLLLKKTITLLKKGKLKNTNIDFITLYYRNYYYSKEKEELLKLLFDEKIIQKNSLDPNKYLQLNQKSFLQKVLLSKSNQSVSEQNFSNIFKRNTDDISINLSNPKKIKFIKNIFNYEREKLKQGYQVFYNGYNAEIAAIKQLNKLFYSLKNGDIPNTFEFITSNNQELYNFNTLIKEELKSQNYIKERISNNYNFLHDEKRRSNIIFSNISLFGNIVEGDCSIKQSLCTMKFFDENQSLSLDLKHKILNEMINHYQIDKEVIPLLHKFIKKYKASLSGKGEIVAISLKESDKNSYLSTNNGDKFSKKNHDHKLFQYKNKPQKILQAYLNGEISDYEFNRTQFITVTNALENPFDNKVAFKTFGIIDKEKRNEANQLLELIKNKEIKKNKYNTKERYENFSKAVDEQTEKHGFGKDCARFFETLEYGDKLIKKVSSSVPTATQNDYLKKRYQDCMNRPEYLPNRLKRQQSKFYKQEAF